jgi:hypothetical protein
MTRARKLFTAASVVFGAACGVAPPPSQFPTADDALGRMRAGYDCALGVRGSAKVDNLSPKGRIKGDVDFTAVVPENIYFTADKFGVTVYTLTSDGKDFKLFDYKNKEFLYGPAKPCNIARLTQAPIPGAALVNLLRGEAPVLVHDSASIAWDSGGYYVIHIPSKHDAEQEIHIEVHPADFQKPWKEQRVRVKYVRITQQGIDLYDVDLDDFSPVSTGKPRTDPDGLEPDVPPIGPECNAELPHTIRMKVPHTLDDVKFTYKEAMWNPPLIPGTFTQPIPGGVRVVPVDCD